MLMLALKFEVTHTMIGWGLIRAEIVPDLASQNLTSTSET